MQSNTKWKILWFLQAKAHEENVQHIFTVFQLSHLQAVLLTGKIIK